MPYKNFHNVRLPLLALSAMLAVGVVFARGAHRVIAEEGSVPSASSANPDVDRLNNEIKAKRDQIESLKKKIEEQQAQIAEKRRQAATLKTQIGILENRVAKTELDIQETQAEIEATSLEIQGLDAAITLEEKEISKNKAYVAEYLRTIYRYDDRGYLEVLLLHDKFSEFFDAVKALQEVEGDLVDRVTALKDHKAALEAQRVSREEKKMSLETLEDKLTAARERLLEEQGGKRVLVVVVQSSETELRRSLAQLRAEQQSIDHELTSLENRLRKQLADNSRFTAIKGTGKVSWPVDPSRGITTYFHDPDYPFRYVFEHPGLDIRAAQGIPVRAAGSGVVGRAKDAGKGYSYIMIIHPGGLSTVYGHVSKILVAEDQFVEAGDVIGLVGGTPGTAGAGNLTTGPHLHFEVRLNGIPVNPLEYLQ